MKNLSIIFCITFITKAAIAQKEQVTLDERNKYIYYHVEQTSLIPADTMYQRCRTALKKSKAFAKVKTVSESATAITLKSKLMLYTSLTVAKHEAGELTYTLNIEFKEGKYRYWLTDFLFTPYERNRYAVYVKAQGDAIPLEQVKAKYDSHVLDNYLEQIANAGNNIGEELKLIINNPSKKANAPATVNTKSGN